VTTHATLRSRRTKAKTVYHVQGLHDRNHSPSPLKIQGQGFGWIVEPVLANGHQDLIAGEEVHAIEAPDRLKPIRATGFAHVPDGERPAGGSVGEGAGRHRVSRQGERHQHPPCYDGHKATEGSVAVGGPDCALHTMSPDAAL